MHMLKLVFYQPKSFSFVHLLEIHESMDLDTWGVGGGKLYGKVHNNVDDDFFFSLYIGADMIQELYTYQQK